LATEKTKVERIKAALIRGFWSFVFPAIGYGVTLAINAVEGVDLTSMSVGNAVIIGGVSAGLYALKKLYWPDTEW
jgi:hypothetical protein